MIYAHLVDGLDHDRREEFDRALNGVPDEDKSKANRERQAVSALMKLPGVAGGA